MLALVLALPALGWSAPATRAAVNATCDILQTDNSWVARNQSVPSGPWIVWASAQIGYKDWALCNPPWPFAPFQSASSAWIAIEGPHLGGLLGGDSIVQVGYIKCQYSDGCNVSGIPAEKYGKVVYLGKGQRQ